MRWLVLFHKQTNIIKDKDHLLSSYFFILHFITSYHYICMYFPYDQLVSHGQFMLSSLQILD